MCASGWGVVRVQSRILCVRIPWWLRCLRKSSWITLAMAKAPNATLDAVFAGRARGSKLGRVWFWPGTLMSSMLSGD